MLKFQKQAYYVFICPWIALTVTFCWFYTTNLYLEAYLILWTKFNSFVINNILNFKYIVRNCAHKWKEKFATAVQFIFC
jgi:hypothetical protein